MDISESNENMILLVPELMRAEELQLRDYYGYLTRTGKDVTLVSSDIKREDQIITITVKTKGVLIGRGHSK